MKVINVSEPIPRQITIDNFQNGHLEGVIYVDFINTSWRVWVIWYTNDICVIIADNIKYKQKADNKPQLPPSIPKNMIPWEKLQIATVYN